ncbi:MAG: ABC transporter ATP-binding protein, partial [Coriobacteriaceae bacterium]|nr:ABC transporter ATP-binding protein [Coriobacteriaceae bacterium]
CRVEPGGILGLAGETGSGKTTLALAFLCYASPGLSIARGSVLISGRKVLDTAAGIAPAKEALRALRGNEVSYVPQDPGSALPPNMSIKEGFASVMKAHGIDDKAEHARRMESLFETVGLAFDEVFVRRYPHQLSGGQQQRVAIAIAFAHAPKLVVMDEPTTGLDATTTQKVIGLVRRMSRQFHASVVFVSHDLRLLLSLADRIAVLHYGEIVEALPAQDFVPQAAHPYTRRLIQALPRTDEPVQEEKLPPKLSIPEAERVEVLRVEGLTAAYGKNAVTHALDFSIERGSCLAFVGESGSGKTTTARCIAGIHGDYEGRVFVEGAELPPRLVQRSLRQRQSVQYVFQNPTAALNPRRTAGSSLVAAIRSYQGLNRKAVWEHAAVLIEDVGLHRNHLHALPHQLSGGQKQRICLARALAAQPTVLVCDEVTSSLDVIVQSEIIDLLHRLQHERNLTVLFITHDFGLARIISVETMVLFEGRIVESGPTAQLIEHPQHPYTQSLIESTSPSAPGR